MIDEIKLDNEVTETLQSKSDHQNELEKEFLKQIDIAKNLKKELNFVEKNFYDKVSNYTLFKQNEK